VSHRFFDHTADVGADIEAPDLGALFTEALRAFTDTLTPLEGVGTAGGREAEREIELEADSLDELLVLWLEELLYLFEVGSLLFSGAEARVEGEGGAYRLHALAHGEVYDPDRHPLKVLIKGVTYHELSVEEGPEGWRARVIFDI